VRALADRRPPSSTPASDIAQRRLVWCDAHATVADLAEEMMEHEVRHVLVEDGGRLVGVVSGARPARRVRHGRPSGHSDVSM
jgi:CBS domain-containing protein